MRDAKKRKNTINAAAILTPLKVKTDFLKKDIKT